MRHVIAWIIKYKFDAVAFDFISDTGTVGPDDLQEDILSFDGIPSLICAESEEDISVCTGPYDCSLQNIGPKVWQEERFIFQHFC
jgi:hypothetical protein